ncbi:MAG: alkaline phosphatase D family protein [Oligoflexia bacterium]|nr:alkaline phosphatase D family protein [Oligoflexia bacterium]
MPRQETLEIYHLPRLIPIIAVWDDHDFGLNNSNSENYPYIKESQKNFLTYFPMNPKYCSYLQRGPGVSTCFSFREQQIVLLDDRSFRLPSGSKDPHAHWGASQEEWCIQKVREQRGTTWLMNGSQFFPHVMWKESVAGDHPEQLKGFVKNIQSTGRKVIFASGDVHYSEISRIEREILGFETYEITSSSIHSKSVPGFPHLVPNPRRVASVGKRNYILVDCNIGGNSNRFKVTSFSPGRTNFQMQIGG